MEAPAPLLSIVGVLHERHHPGPCQQGSTQPQTPFPGGIGDHSLLLLPVHHDYHLSFSKNLLEEETFRQTELVMASLESTRSYIREVLRPRMYEEIGEDRFIIEAMSTSYITRVIMDRFKDELPAFKYRRTALGARNPSFEANREERKMIEYFRQHPEDQEWHGVQRLNSERYFTIYRPVVYKSSCLHCHGNPDDAPLSISSSYGKLGAFIARKMKSEDSFPSRSPLRKI